MSEFKVEIALLIQSWLKNIQRCVRSQGGFSRPGQAKRRWVE